MNAVNLRGTAPSGGTIVDHLLDYWKRRDVVGFSQWELALVEWNKLLFQLVWPLQLLATSSPSLGYEPFLIERGFNRLAAHVLARSTVHRGTRVAVENKRLQPVVESIRFLAKPGRQGAAISRRAQILLAAWKQTRIIETIFERAGDAHKLEFIMLLQTSTKGDKLARRRIAEIAADLVPHLPKTRGRKVSAASAAHEFLLEEAARVTKSEGYTYDEYEEDFTDPLTKATRAEFGDADFDPRPAYRRVKKRLE